MPAGRPPSYKPEYAEQALSLCLLGATDKQLAESFSVTEKTINAWKKDYPEFCKSVKEAKDYADSNVVNSLYQQALSGNVTAQIFWLKNRQKEQWRDKHEVEHTGTVAHKVDNASDDELEDIATRGRNAPVRAAKSATKPH